MVRMVGTIGQQGHRWGHRVQLPEVMCGFEPGVPSQGVVCVGWPGWVLCVAVAWVEGGFRVRGSAGDEVLRTFDGPLASALCGGCVRSDESWLRPVGLWSGDMCVLWWATGYVTGVIAASESVRGRWGGGSGPCVVGASWFVPEPIWSLACGV